ncbi:MAG: hypothetical protein ACRDNI_13325 [Gaiellaceae bacterium]
MTLGGPGTRGRGRTRGRSAGRRAVAWLVRLAVIVVVFLAGFVIGKAVEDAPEPGGTQTIVRTLEPLTVPSEEGAETSTGP